MWWGPGCSGMEIAYDLAEGGASKVWLSARTPPNILMRTGPGGLPGDVIGVTLLHFPPRIGDAIARFGRKQDLGDLTEYGLPVPEEGVMSRLRRTGQAPAIVDMEVIDAIKAGRIEIVRGVASLDETGVELADGARVEPDAVICATGYSRVLEPLVGHLGVLDERGMPRVRGATDGGARPALHRLCAAARRARLRGQGEPQGRPSDRPRAARRVAAVIRQRPRGAALSCSRPITRSSASTHRGRSWSRTPR